MINNIKYYSNDDKHGSESDYCVRLLMECNRSKIVMFEVKVVMQVKIDLFDRRESTIKHNTKYEITNLFL